MHEKMWDTEYLIRWAKNKESNAREVAVEWLGYQSYWNCQDYPVIDTLLELLIDGKDNKEIDADEFLRIECIRSLGRYVNQNTYAKLALIWGLVKDTNPYVRAQSAKEIGWWKVKEAFPFLLETMADDEYYSVREACIEAIGALHMEEGIAPLMDRLQKTEVDYEQATLLKALYHLRVDKDDIPNFNKLNQCPYWEVKEAISWFESSQ